MDAEMLRNVLTMLGTPSRIRVCFTGSILIAVVSGTCLIQTRIFISISSVWCIRLDYLIFFSS